jgi:hypothetical protein
MAQSKAPSMVLSHGGDSSFHGTSGWGNAPHDAAALLFYGGDTNTSDPNEQGFANGNTLLTPNVTTYFAVTAPKSPKVVATGILYNQDATQNDFNPATGTYDIRVKVSEGNGGSSVASGSGAQTATATGRQPFGLTEYATSVTFAKPLTPTGGTTYWVNESPQCTNSGDSLCSAEQFFANNTTQQTNGINANDQPKAQIFFNSTFFGFTWANWCDASLGQNAQQCEWGSFGIYGHT